MIVAGLLATVVTYAVLRQAAAPGSEESVAADDIHAGQVVTGPMFGTTNVKAPLPTLSGILTPKDIAGMSGQGQSVVEPARRARNVSRNWLIRTNASMLSQRRTVRGLTGKALASGVCQRGP